MAAIGQSDWSKKPSIYEEEGIDSVISAETRQWIQDKAPDLFDQGPKESLELRDIDIEQCFGSIKNHIQNLYEQIMTLNFSAGYEFSKRQTISVNEFAPFCRACLELQSYFNKYKRSQEFLERFCHVCRPLLQTLSQKITLTAQASRSARHEQLLSNPGNDDDYICDLAIAEAHLETFTNGKFSYLEELSRLLNLSQFPQINRIPTNKEQRCYRFLLKLQEHCG